MPYIPVEDRERLFNPGETPKNSGELSFIIALIIDQYWHENGKNYQAFNDILGALTGAQLEYHRRKISYYETAKMFANGDVYRNETLLDTGEGSTEDAPTEPLRPRPDRTEVPPTSSTDKEG